MRIIQTFWSGWSNPREKSYGWPNAEYNLMSWALSCSCLRKHYEEVELYTDERGYEVLIEELHLPYTKVHVVYDESLCLPHHWAYAKIKTYSMQEQPFVHVDGDVYLPNPFPESFACAPLVAQNREIGTVYYREMMNRVLNKSEIKIPQYVANGIMTDSIDSYNMGVFGGTDIKFIQEYCQNAFDFIDENQLNDVTKDHARVDCNLLFEQMFFAAKVNLEKRDVSVLCRPMCDEGYTSRDFCNLTNFSNARFFHILGGHKQSLSVCYALEKVLLREFPFLYLNVCGLFKNRHPLLYGMTEQLNITADYPLPNDFVEAAKEDWSKLSQNQLMQMGKDLSGYFRFLSLDNQERNMCVISVNPHMKLWISEQSFSRIVGQKKDEIPKASRFVKGLCLVPPISSDNIQVIPLSQLGCRIIQQIKGKKQTYGEMKHSLRYCFSEKLRKQHKSMNNLFFNEIVYLFYYGIFLNKEG